MGSQGGGGKGSLSPGRLDSDHGSLLCSSPCSGDWDENGSCFPKQSRLVWSLRGTPRWPPSPRCPARGRPCCCPRTGVVISPGPLPPPRGQVPCFCAAPRSANPAGALSQFQDPLPRAHLGHLLRAQLLPLGGGGRKCWASTRLSYESYSIDHILSF